jgi:hypothetical protein
MKSCVRCHGNPTECRCLAEAGERFARAGERIAEACNEIGRHAANLRIAMQPLVERTIAAVEGFEKKVENRRMFAVARRISRLRTKTVWQHLLDE